MLPAQPALRVIRAASFLALTSYYCLNIEADGFYRQSIVTRHSHWKLEDTSGVCACVPLTSVALLPSIWTVGHRLSPTPTDGHRFTACGPPWWSDHPSTGRRRRALSPVLLTRNVNKLSSLPPSIIASSLSSGSVYVYIMKTISPHEKSAR